MPGPLDPDDGGQQLLLGKMLLERGLITPDQLREALVERARHLSGDRPSTPLGGILVQKGYLTDAQLHGLMVEQGGDASPPASQTTTLPAPVTPPPMPGDRSPSPGSSARLPAAPPAPGSSARMPAAPPAPGSSPYLRPPSSSAHMPAVPPAPPARHPSSSQRIPAVSGPTLPPIDGDRIQEGDQLGKYRLQRELGRGGMGVVYEALDTQLNRKVALKLMLTNPNADPKDRALEEERFVQEAQLSAKLKHPNIVTVYEAGLLEGRQFLSMEMIDGQAFGDWRKSVTIREQIRVLADVSSAVHHAHEQGILHRDLKPRNILVAGSGHAYVTDFGLAKSLGKNVHQSLTGSGAVVGTPAYMSPEQAQGLDRVDWRTDIYSLGVILYECMTGRTPFTGESPIEILMKVVKDPVPPPLEVVEAGNAIGLDKAIENICLKALAKKDRDRYVTAQAFADDLNKWLAGEKVHVVAPKPQAKPHRKMYAVAAALFLMMIGLLVFLGLKSARPSVRPQLDAAERYMAEEKYAEALIEYRVALATDANNPEAIMGAKAAQEGMKRKEAEREESFKKEVVQKFADAEDKQRKALEARELENKAATEEERQRLAEERRRAEDEARRAAELAAKYEADFRLTTKLVVNTPGGKADEWRESVNLLAMVDPRRHVIAGSWDVQDAGRLVTDRSPFSRVEIPFTLPQGEYDFRLVFERRSGAGGLSVILSRSGRQFRFELGGEANTRTAFETVSPDGTTEYPASRTDLVAIRNDALYTLLLQVRAGGTKAFLNGQPLLEWKTDYAEARLHPRWKLRNTMRLGVGSHESETRFHRMELLEVTGKGRKAEAQPAPLLKSQNIAPSQLKPGLLAEYYLGTSLEALAMRRVDSSIDFRWGEGAAWLDGPVDAFSIRWSGYLVVPRTQKYYFTAVADDGIRVMIDDQQMLGSWNSRTEAPRAFEALLEEGYHKLVVEYYELAYLARVELGWSTSPTQPSMPIPLKSFLHLATDPGAMMSNRPPELVTVIPGKGQNVTSVCFDPSGRLVAIAGEDKKVRLIEPTTQREMASAANHPTGVLSVAFSPDGSTFASGTRERDNKVRVWGTQNSGELRLLDGPTASVQSVAYSKDGKRLAAGSYDASVRVWTLDNNDPPLVLTGHSGGVETVAFRPDGKLLVTGGLDHLLRVWELPSGKPVRSIEGHADAVTCVAFTPGGRTIASGSTDGLIKLWDSDTGELLKVLVGHGEEVVCIAFSADGLLLAAGGHDGMVRLWDPVRGIPLKVLPGHMARVSSLAFSPTGRMLASGSADTTVRVWNLER